MSESSVVAAPGWRAGDDAVARTRAVPDARRWLQLGLAAIWLLDGVLQYQSFMFTKAFGQTLAATAPGNPAVLADPITWAALIVEHHPVSTNAAFATIQLLLGLGIAFRPTLRAALAASVVWSVAVWWLGEGLGGVLNGGASPVNGAPGAVIIYALLAILLWPASGISLPFAAARPVGIRAAQGLWLVLWGSLAYFAVTSANRTAQGLHDMVAGMASGEPGWLAGINRGAASLLEHRARRRRSCWRYCLMGIAMAGMLTASLTTLPNWTWEAVFAVLTAWFAWRVAVDARSRNAGAAAGSHYTTHLVHSAAMVYMFAAFTAPMAASTAGAGMSGMSGMSSSGASGMGTLQVPTLALVFALLLAGSAVWDIDQITSPAPHSALASARIRTAILPAAALVGPGASALSPAASAPRAGRGSRGDGQIH